LKIGKPLHIGRLQINSLLARVCSIHRFPAGADRGCSARNPCFSSQSTWRRREAG
jgi:hypothetical protein